MQYKHNLMHRLTEINNKKIIIVVAHPDDETLWFFQSIQTLKLDNEIIIFCLTHASTSPRGREIQKVAATYGVKVVFGHCEDTGIVHLLKEKELRMAFIKIFSKYKFDLAITHPPHGGEKPHPHHIQLFHMTRQFCEYYFVDFGFFSEQKLLEEKASDYYFYFSLKMKKYILNRLMLSYRLLSENQNKLRFLLKGILTILLNRKKYTGYESDVNIAQKQSALSTYESQESILKNYNSYYKKSEFFFLENRIHNKVTN